MARRRRKKDDPPKAVMDWVAVLVLVCIVVALFKGCT